MKARYHITYAASGRMPDLAGELCVEIDARLGPIPCILNGDRGVVLDPRAIVTDDNGQVVYTPRDYPLDMHTKDMRTWLLGHPEWGLRKGGDAE